MKNLNLLSLILLLFPLALTAQDFDVQGHRGARGEYPESSVYGFIAALNMGVSTLELDVVISKDGEVVVSHDLYFNHLICKQADGQKITKKTRKDFKLYEMYYNEIREFDCGSTQHPKFPNQINFENYKPSLDEVISRVEYYIAQNNLPKINYSIEIKSSSKGDGVYHPKPAVFVDLVMNIIIKHKIENKTIIQSFDTRIIKLVHDKFPEIKTSYLISFSFNLIKTIKNLNFKPDIISPNYRIVNKKIIAFCKNNNYKIIPWTVNNKTEIERLINLGVDGIISDYPQLVQEVLNQKL